MVKSTNFQNNEYLNSQKLLNFISNSSSSINNQEINPYLFPLLKKNGEIIFFIEPM